MRNFSKILLLWVLDVLGINALCGILNRKRAIILFYHGICDDDFDLLKGYNERHISKSSFKKQLGYLKRKGYVFVNMTELIDALKNKGKIEKYVVLTFDDGFRNVVENAYPIMQEFNAKGCFYLVSDLIGTNQLLWTDYVETVIRNQQQEDFQFIFRGGKFNYKLGDKRASEYAMLDIKTKLRKIPDKERLEHLRQFSNHELDNIPKEFLMASWEQIKKLDSQILEIGSHTRSHPNCENLISDDELEREINSSKIDIEKNIGREILHFCYPAGSYNDRVIANVKKSGYKSAVTVRDGFSDENSDLYQLKRIGVSENFLFFKAYISGSYNMIRRIKAALGLGSERGY